MWPREHGAYGQLAFPLVTAFIVAGVTPPAALTALAAVAGFLAHEPLLVLLGRRGPRERREQGRRASTWLAGSGSLALVAGLAAVWSSPAGIRWSFALPLLPAAVFGLALAQKRERSARGEIAAATAFSLVAVPVCLAAGSTARIGLAVGVAFACFFAASILSVRVIILRVRGGGDPEAMRTTRSDLFSLTTYIGVLLIVAASSAWLPWITLAAVAPGILVALALALKPPPATRLRAVGWTLVSASALTAIMLMVGLPRG